jgi:serralysin
MALNINVSGAGVDFAAYLADFNSNFAPSGWGYFSDNPTDFSGDEFAVSDSSDVTLPIADGQAAVFDSGAAGSLNYDFATHVLAGTLDAIEFGTGLSYSSGSDDFTTTPDVSISGFGLSGSGSGNAVHNLVYDTMQGNTAVLNTHLAANAINFTGGSGADTFSGYGFNDTIAGGGGADSLTGAGGADTLNGAGGADTLSGGAAADTLTGAAGNDRLIGGAGADSLTGGADNDTFAFSGSFGTDRITDFQAGSGVGDVIEFSSSQFANFAAVLAATNDVGGNAVITVDGATSVTLVGVTEASFNANDFLFV